MNTEENKSVEEGTEAIATTEAASTENVPATVSEETAPPAEGEADSNESELELEDEDEDEDDVEFDDGAE